MEHQEPYRTDNHSPIQDQRKRSGRVIRGMLVILIGMALLMRNTDIISFPYWIFSWKMLLIFIGLYIGIKNSFRNIAWFVLIAVGSFFLIDDIMPWFNFRPYFWPMAIIVAGMIMILGTSRFTRRSKYEKEGPYQQQAYTRESSNSHSDSEEYIDTSNLFGEVKKKILSKNFRGGESITFIGSAEYDLSQADIQGEINLEIVQTLGRTRLIVPAHWEVRSEIVTILGSVEDKGMHDSGYQNSGKRLLLKGTSVFGSIEVRTV